MAQWLVSLTEDLIILSSCPTVAHGLSYSAAQKDEHHQGAYPVPMDSALKLSLHLVYISNCEITIIW